MAPAPTPTPEAPAPAPVAAGLAPDGGDLARLTAELTRREAENAELRNVLAVRDAVIESLEADLAERATAVDGLEARLAASEAEFARLRQEIAELSAAADAAAKLALFEPAAGEPSATRLAAVRLEAPDLDPLFAANPPAGLPPLALAEAELVSETAADSVTIHFDFASSRLTPGGQIHAAAAAVVISNRTLIRVRLVGHTDRVGGPAANRRLAARRAGTVADFLVEAGVPPEMIEIDDRGEADLPVATADGVREPLNRSVEIRILPL